MTVMTTQGSVTGSEIDGGKRDDSGTAAGLALTADSACEDDASEAMVTVPPCTLDRGVTLDPDPRTPASPFPPAPL